MHSFAKLFISILSILIIINIGCVSERGHSPVFGPGENDNTDGGNNDHGINIKYANELPEIEQAIFDLTNEHRVNLGLPELAWSNTVAKQCRQHSSNMALGYVSFGHTGLSERINKIRQNFPNTFGVELISRHGPSTKLPEHIITEWLQDLEQRQYIEGDYQITGVGVAKSANNNFYITQIYIKQGD